jgi:hypothetical protein
MSVKFTIQYIPLSKISPDLTLKMTDRIKKLRSLMWDCMYILVVRKNRKDGNYSIVSGLERFEYLRKHTKNIYAPCIVDQCTSTGIKSWLHRFLNQKPLDDFPMTPTSWSIVCSFLKHESRFRELSRFDQIKVLILAVRYKRTVIFSMKAKVNDMLRNDH